LQESQQIQNPVFLPTSTLAVISTCSSFVGLFFIPIIAGIIGIICGVMAFGETRSKPPRKSGDVFAVIGIVVGVIGLILWIFVILMALAGIIFPSICCCGFLSNLGNTVSPMNGY
jgi:hypothetical protein